MHEIVILEVFLLVGRENGVSVGSSLPLAEHILRIIEKGILNLEVRDGRRENTSLKCLNSKKSGGKPFSWPCSLLCSP